MWTGLVHALALGLCSGIGLFCGAEAATTKKVGLPGRGGAVPTRALSSSVRAAEQSCLTRGS
jgi:hypothetical protein